jgi:hypothetical protein
MTVTKESEKRKAAPKLSKKAQYERFRETARKLGVDNEKSSEAFEHAFAKIVPAKSKAKV